MPAGDLHIDPNNRGQCANDHIDELIAGLANRQGGVVGRRQLLARGVTAKAVDYRVKVGRLRVIHSGVYAVGHDAIPIRGRLCAALLVAGPGSALSHRTAAHVLSLLPSMPQFVEATTTNRTPRNRPGLVFHRARTLQTTRRHQLPVTTPIRTLRDLAATCPEREVERAASEALVLKLVTSYELVTQHGPGAAVLATLIVGPTRSGLERAFLKAVLKLNLPMPVSNHDIGPYNVDFYWPSHDLVVETDGADYHEHDIARRRDRRKDKALRARGHEVMRIPEEALDDGVAEVARLLSRPATRTAP